MQTILHPMGYIIVIQSKTRTLKKSETNKISKSDNHFQLEYLAAAHIIPSILLSSFVTSEVSSYSVQEVCMLP